ncbi:mechanosensitive ion channel [Marinilongibacter aquaticus]|uniref:mechanosensitive ion channel family protein n=1 Tax=Marinilongibacter aquaticus TaxID=2975157 RepID=UPI0021BDE3A2|nr:mechanosensitive ion channel domain-containing protein [Marinilongibacter aquaticus]UBM59377.1 mechanosensitive ion channel [Marinilongibacter aquaticus]
MDRFQEIMDYRLIYINDKFSLEVVDIFSIAVILILARLAISFFAATMGRLVKSNKIGERNKQSFTLLFKYFVWVAAIVMSLRVSGIDLTWLMAGSAALLVGLGLGLQQIFSDIVSGIFLLVEGSVKIGDIMEVDGIIGKVRKINLRTSEIVSRDGIVIIVPNHRFIVENVINWSHNASITRFDVKVGVAYGTDPEKVSDLLKLCAEEHPQVIITSSHQPIVRLINFGDSSLDFQLLFWSRNGFQIENTKSELRFMIVKKFKENDIEIPFPQRDLHLKSGKF